MVKSNQEGQMPDKAKPSVRRGRKAAGLIEDGRAAEGLAFGVFGLFVLERSANRRDICISQSNSSKIVQRLLPGGIACLMYWNPEWIQGE